MAALRESQIKGNPLNFWLVALLIVLSCGGLLVSAAQAQPEPPAEPGTGEAAPLDRSVPISALDEQEPVVGAVEPARFAGWFQPWLVGILIGIPLAGAIWARRRDVSQMIRRRAWRRRAGSNDS